MSRRKDGKDRSKAGKAAKRQRLPDSGHVIELSAEDQRRFAEAILNPPEPGPVWRRALESYRRLIKESRD